MLKIKTYGDDVLRKKAALVPAVDREITELIQAMFEKMKEDNGLGLAAPQVGILKRLFVCHVKGDIPRAFVNPEIIATSEEQVSYEEGCLSIPGVWADVIRSEWITVQARDERGKLFTLEAEGILARVILHEIDHLNGVLFIDRISEKKRLRILKPYHQKEKV